MNNKHKNGSTAPSVKQRRTFLLGLSALIGASAAEQILGGNGFTIARAYADSKANSDPSPKVLSQAQLLTLQHICQTVIPKTDTLGAGDVDTHGFIDNQLYHCFDQQAQSSVSDVISKIEKHANTRYKKLFPKLSLPESTELLSNIDTGQNGFNQAEKSQFKFLKYLIVFGYYTSEIGASSELKYDVVPGGFKSAVPLEDIGSAWGSRAFF